MKPLLYVDGYNVIFKSERYMARMDRTGVSDPFEQARELLISDVAAYAKGKYEPVVGYAAHRCPNGRVGGHDRNSVGHHALFRHKTLDHGVGALPCLREDSPDAALGCVRALGRDVVRSVEDHDWKLLGR